MNQKNMDEKLSIIQQLIKLSNIDNKSSYEEQELIYLIARTLSISKKQVEELYEKKVVFSPPKLEFSRIIQFQRLVLLANIDLNVHEKELQSLKKAGFLLGLRKDAINKVLDEMERHEKGNIPHEKLIEIFKIYHN
jgi:hypothetical protein